MTQIEVGLMLIVVGFTGTGFSAIALSFSASRKKGVLLAGFVIILVAGVWLIS